MILITLLLYANVAENTMVKGNNPPAGNPAGGVSKTIWKELKMQTMTEQEQKNVAVEKFVAIQRIKKYGNEELEYQEKI